MNNAEHHMMVRDLTMAYGSFVLMQDVSFTVNRGDIFIIMGGSGCGKSTLMKTMVGLKAPAKGLVIYGDVNFWETAPDERDQIMKRCPLEFHDPGGKRGPASGRVHGPEP